MDGIVKTPDTTTSRTWASAPAPAASRNPADSIGSVVPAPCVTSGVTSLHRSLLAHPGRPNTLCIQSTSGSSTMTTSTNTAAGPTPSPAVRQQQSSRAPPPVLSGLVSTERTSVLARGGTGVKGTGLSRSKPPCTPSSDSTTEAGRHSRKRPPTATTSDTDTKRRRTSQSESDAGTPPAGQGGSSGVSSHHQATTPYSPISSSSRSRSATPCHDDPTSSSSRSRSATPCHDYPARSRQSPNQQRGTLPGPQEESNSTGVPHYHGSPSRDQNTTLMHSDALTVALHSEGASPIRHVPRWGSDWRPHGGHRQRTAHASADAIQRTRHAFCKAGNHPQSRTS